MFIPPKVLTNLDLEKMVDTSDEWIQTRTGIRERHIAEKGLSSGDLGYEAAKAALAQSGLTAADLDLIIVATITPHMLFPSTACYIQAKLGARCGAFDMAAACSGFPYAVAVAEAFIASGIHKNVMVIGSEVLSGFIDWKDRSTCVLFGDGAGAAILSRSVNNERGIICSYLGSDGTQADILKIPGGGSAHPTTEDTLKQGLHYLKMEGSDVFKVAVRTMEEAVREVARRGGIAVSEINCLIPHQANSRILNAVGERLEMSSDRVYTNVEIYGNMSSASTAVALCEAVQKGKIKKGDYVALVAFGGGLTWAATLIKW
jgi:3-oxoacyl-[acyl-carrier-protein] synthase-3